MSMFQDPDIVTFPSQKRSMAVKGEKFFKDCIDGAINMIFFNKDSGVRESKRNMQVNYNLANDILDPKDVERVVNPYGLEGVTFPSTMKNYPLSKPKIDLLVGEESKRAFDWKVTVVNPEAISEKQMQIKEMYTQLLMDHIGQQGFDENQLRKRIDNLNKYVNHEYRDLRERAAYHTLAYLYQEQQLKEKFNKGMEDALIAGEECYCVDLVAGEPVVRVLNPMNVFAIRSGESPYLEDADIIVEVGYYPVGYIIDTYYEYLKPGDIDALEHRNQRKSPQADFVNYEQNVPLPMSQEYLDNIYGGLIDTEYINEHFFSGIYDEEGNIRVIRVVWKSMRKLGKLKYYDQDGFEHETIVPEQYQPNELLGEEVKWFWVSEWMEGTRIGEDIYVKMQARPIQFRSMSNLSTGGSGYVGTAYNVHNGKARGLMDFMKPYQYMYDEFMYRTQLAFLKAKGRIGRLPMHLIPDGWTIDDWIYYAEVLGWAVEDAFKEGKKGEATGKLAGNMSNQSPVMDMELGNYIQQHIFMLSKIEEQIGEIAGVSKQRQGQIENRELVGNVERAVVQSSHITEKWFMLHDNTKLRVLRALLETAKAAWRDSSKKVQYVLDDLSTTIYEIEGSLFNESEYGVFITNSAADTELIQSMRNMAQAALGAGTITMNQVLDIYMSPSVMNMRRKLEHYEQETMQRAEQQQQQQQEAALQMQQQQQQWELTKLEMEYADNQADRENDVLLESMRLSAQGEKAPQAQDNTAQLSSKEAIEREKIASQERMAEKELALQDRIEKAKLAMAERVAEKEIAVKKIAAKRKPTTTKD